MVYIRTLPQDLQKIAIEQLNEVPERLPEDVENLKTWIKQQPYLKARMDDQFLVAFLRGCKFSLEKAKSKIEKFYTLKTKYPDFYRITNVDDPKLRELVRMGVGLNLPTPLNGNGARIMYIRPGAYPADKYTFEEIMCLAHAMQDITLLEDDFAIVNGFIDILDMSQMTSAHLLKMTPTIVKKMTTFEQEALPLRQKATHIINTPTGFEPVFNMLKPLMPAKQQQRLFVHGNKMEDLFKHIPQEYLPKELGGKNSSIEELIKEDEQKFLEYRNYFIEDLEYCTNEKLRPGKPVDYDAIFGIEGSFRKLNVD